jgi:hypothetical protein
LLTQIANLQELHQKDNRLAMITIEINERTKAGKALLETARIMAQKNEGIEITSENSILVAKMKRNHKNDLLSEPEKNDFLKELQEV